MSVTDTSIPMSMSAVVCWGPKDYRYTTDRPIPALCPLEHEQSSSTLSSSSLDPPPPMLGTDEVLVKVARCGICAGDAKCYHGAPLFWGDGDSLEGYCKPPVVPGHEFIGHVSAIGRKAAVKYGVDIGDQVIAEQIVPCWQCMYCLKGLHHLCEVHDIYGFRQRTHGGMADYMTFPSGSIVYKVPHSIHVDESVYIEPLSCAVHGVERADIQFCDTVVVSGCGAIGLGMLCAAKLKHPARLVAVDMINSRLEVARKCGADILLNPDEVDVVKEVKAMTSGYGCDVYIECAGHPSSVKQGLQCCRKRATFVEFSVFSGPTSVDWTVIGDTKELNIRGGHLSGSTGYRQAIRMLQDRDVPVDDIVTHCLNLDQWKEGIDLVTQGTESIKVALKPPGA
eukprot:TRINITY_DN3106_c0_g1_i1.p1 TRINITY_DN3106_c0_g1~~TRINITY_DN3106_c0_g1_i1.p1  ORF type:complete len:416 (-),score=49.41 TRINITY_DN3106_c0_g1_i1:35-1219(-)